MQLKQAARESAQGFLAYAIQQLDEAKTAPAYFQFQYWLLKEALWCEKNESDLEEQRWQGHSDNLRHLGDGLAQILIHADSLRQLAKNSRTGARLSDQPDALAQTVGEARKLARLGRPVVIADLTNLVRIGDVIDCRSREYPEIIEVKKTKPARGGGRVAKQRQRMASVVRALNEGVAQMPDQPTPNAILVDLDLARLEHDFDLVEQVVTSALKENRAAFQIQDDSIVWAGPHQPDRRAQIDLAVEAFGGDDNRHLYAGTTRRILDYPLARVPSPVTWPISVSSRVAVTTGAIDLVRVIDLSAYVRAAQEQGLRLEFAEKNDRGDVFMLDRPGKSTLTVNEDAIRDVVFGFRSVSDSARTTARALPSFLEASEGPAEQASNVHEYRRRQAALGLDAGAPDGRVVHGNRPGAAKPMRVGPGRFVEGPWTSNLLVDEGLARLLSEDSRSN